jgi:hypothetical protein
MNLRNKYLLYMRPERAFFFFWQKERAFLKKWKILSIDKVANITCQLTYTAKFRVRIQMKVFNLTISALPVRPYRYLLDFFHNK